MTLEICASNFQSAVNAQQAGAHRIELCSELATGGITPSYGLLKRVIHELHIPVMVLIRPRSGDFIYSNVELEIMLHDIEICKDLGAAGIVSGVLTPDFKIDLIKTSQLIEQSRPLPFTFHRAFDHVNQPFTALNDLINLGATRILTSGQQPAAVNGIGLLTQLQQHAGDDLTILPGGGINADHVLAFAKANFKELHASATSLVVQHHEEKLAMNAPRLLQENHLIVSDIAKIKELVKTINTTHQ